MTHLFFDDSHHAQGEFSLGAFVVFDGDPSEKVNQALTAFGFVPGQDEYKSSHPHAADTRWIELRRLLYRIAGAATIGITIAPYGDRSRFGLHTLTGLNHILNENVISRPVAVYLDQGLFQSKHEFDKWRRESGLPDDIDLTPECDSRRVPGIQVADLVAHTCAIALLGRLGISDKTIHDDEEGEYQLSFEMWARLRYNFFTRNLTDPELQEEARRGLMDSRNGLYLAPGCNEQLVQMADERFGRTWLGCIH
ncbi:MAG TPA: DUF3800 domain-containing protein [Gemmatimonadaceae bacterium]|nr:DUF3800 domain-containing protein [Gemmatimonadaceae bacterium]